MNIQKYDKWIALLWIVAIFMACNLYVSKRTVHIGTKTVSVPSLALNQAYASGPCASNWCFSIQIGDWTMYTLSQSGFWDAQNSNHHGDYGFDFVVAPTIKCGSFCSGLPDSQYTKISYDDPACSHDSGTLGTLWYEFNGGWYHSYCVIGTGHHHAQWQFGSLGCPPDSCEYLVLPKACTITEGPCTGG